MQPLVCLPPPQTDMRRADCRAVSLTHAPIGVAFADRDADSRAAVTCNYYK